MKPLIDEGYFSETGFTKEEAALFVQAAQRYQALKLKIAMATSEVLRLRKENEALLEAAKWALASMKDHNTSVKAALENAIAQAEGA